MRYQTICEMQRKREIERNRKVSMVVAIELFNKRLAINSIKKENDTKYRVTIEV